MSTSRTPRCPACGGVSIGAAPSRAERLHCAHCGHGWLAADAPQVDYATLSQRTLVDDPHRARRLAGRVGFIGELPRSARVLEVGCAEGLLGAALREACPDVYLEAVEPSADAVAAARIFDVVHRQPLEHAPIDVARFDRVLAFHVLEHLEDPAGALNRLGARLSGGGALVAEVPRRSGHPQLPEDLNREHRHFFSTASICAMLHRAGLEAVRVEAGCYESPLYPDSLRVMALRRPDPDALAAVLRERLSRILAGDSAIWGTGGDFENYVRPYLPEGLPVRLLDSSPEAQGRVLDGRVVEAPDAAGPVRTVLVATCRHEQSIREALRHTAFAAAKVIGLADFLDGSLA